MKRRDVSEKPWGVLHGNFMRMKRRDRYGSATPKDGFWTCPVPYPWLSPWNRTSSVFQESIILVVSDSIGLDFRVLIAAQRLDRHRKAVGTFDPKVLAEHDRREVDRRAVGGATG